MSVGNLVQPLVMWNSKKLTMDYTYNKNQLAIINNFESVKHP